MKKTLQGSVKLNIGCGLKKREGFVNIDISKEVKPDYVVDLNKQKLPFKDNSVDHIYTRHVYEHFEDPVKVFEEFCRVCKPGATINIIVPYMWSKQDVLWHKTMGFHEKTFSAFYDNPTRPYYTKARVKPLKITRSSWPGWRRFIPFKSFLSNFLMGIYYDIDYTFEVIKKN